MGKLQPKKYGERVNQVHSDPDGNAMGVLPVTVYLPDNGRDTPTPAA
jgi:hypothetical protein